MSDKEVTYSLVAHIVSRESYGICTGRLVMRDDKGFNVAVLAVGESKVGEDAALDDAVLAFENKIKALK